MQTIVGISLSPVYILPLMFTFPLLDELCYSEFVIFYLIRDHLWYKTHPAVLSGIWLIQYSCGVNYFIIITTALPYSCCPYSFVHTANGGNGCTDRFITRNIHPTFFNCRNAITNHD
ncbi:hypothetical protein FORC81_p444 (plasmid) [Escherichia coli]|nr:hypothetical protein FORC81_p444 [Escherichia coli]